MINHKFKIKQKLLIILVFLFTLNCSQNKDSYYFKFDNVEHYSIDIEEGELFDLETKKNLKKNEQLKIDIIINNKPEKLSDSLFVLKLTTIGFSKQEVSKEKFRELNEIFREKSHDEVYALACIHVYRDLLIFKKSDSIIGIAKICFSCLDSQIVGTNSNTMAFGQSGDYGKLKRLLKRK